MESSAHRNLRPQLITRDVPAGLSRGGHASRITGPQEALAVVKDELILAEKELRNLLMSEVVAIPEVAGYLVDAGGKRLRPALTGLGARVVGEENRARLMCVGELIHLGSLLHDDVVDWAEERRGRTAAHHIFGNATSILAGDFCLARAVLLASEEGGEIAARELARAVTEMAEGEVLQLQWAGNLSCTVDTYLTLINKKSAALIAWCVAAGAWAAGEGEIADALTRYGRDVGIAFQITDDVLDYLPGTGKVPGKDLMERKVTLPLLYAMEELEGLRDRLITGTPSEQTVNQLMEEIRGSGALDRALAHAKTCVANAHAHLDAVPEGEARDALWVLGDYLVERTT